MIWYRKLQHYTACVILFLAVDMQLLIVAAPLTLILVNFQNRSLQILVVLVVASSVLNGVLAYIFNWQSVMYITYPRTLKSMYRGIPSFTKFYHSTWGSLPACFIGLLGAFFQFKLQKAGVKLTSYKWLNVPYFFTVAIFGWIASGYYLRQFMNPLFMALYLAVERPLLCLMTGIIFMGTVNGFEGWLKHFFAWRGWHAMGRMSLSVLMVHWSVNITIAASRPHAVATSALNWFVDWIATGWFSYILAIPLTIMVEMPVQRFINALIFKFFAPKEILAKVKKG